MSFYAAESFFSYSGDKYDLRTLSFDCKLKHHFTCSRIRHWNHLSAVWHL